MKWITNIPIIIMLAFVGFCAHAVPPDFAAFQVDTGLYMQDLGAPLLLNGSTAIAQEHRTQSAANAQLAMAGTASAPITGAIKAVYQPERFYEVDHRSKNSGFGGILITFIALGVICLCIVAMAARYDRQPRHTDLCHH